MLLGFSPCRQGQRQGSSIYTTIKIVQKAPGRAAVVPQVSSEQGAARPRWVPGGFSPPRHAGTCHRLPKGAFVSPRPTKPPSDGVFNPKAQGNGGLVVLSFGVEAGWGRSSPGSQKPSTRQDPARSPRAPQGQHEATNPSGSGTRVGTGLLPDELCPPLGGVWGRARADGANGVSAAAPLQDTAPLLTFPLLLPFAARVIRNLRVIFQSHDNSKCQPLTGGGAGRTGRMLCWGWGGPGDHKPLITVTPNNCDPLRTTTPITSPLVTVTLNNSLKTTTPL